MKILKISGRNLASLAGEFCVDFEQQPLVSCGLFAISGPTGAGKSTLLDALCLALYDATPRLLKMTRGASMLPDVGDETVSAQDPRTLLRRGAAEGHAEVDFVGNDGQRYRSRWSVRRARSKAAGGLQKTAMSLHRLPELSAIGGTKTEVTGEIERRIGLSFEQFTRAVLLAQNEFSAFLKTEENERGELLETLTGSAVYSLLSKRAFERYRAEQGALQLLSARLADQVPLAQEARAQVDADSAAADATLAVLDARKGALEQQLRWHQDGEALRQNAAQAQQALDAAAASVAAAAPRRHHLATLDAAQEARALLAELTRLEAEGLTAQAAIASGSAQLQGAQAAQQAAALAVANAAALLQTAESAQAGAAPLLDQAKTLDARIALLDPAHSQAAQARDTAQRELQLTHKSMRAQAAERDASRLAHQAGAAWLAAHGAREQLASQWPRWERLLVQAEQAAGAEAALAASLEQAEQLVLGAGTTEAAATAELGAASASLQALEAARQNAIAALSAFDAEAMRGQRAALEAQRDSIIGAEKIWNELASLRERLARAGAQASQLALAQASAQQRADAARAAAPAHAAALAQAERSLKLAELACADGVETLRATLSDEQPCPVCGSSEHPYQHQNAQLHTMLDSLRAELDRCRGQAQESMAAQSAQQALAETHATSHAQVAAECERLARALASTESAWAAHALAVDGGDPAAWLGQQLARLKLASAQLDRQEQAARQAGAARDAAQAACDKAAARSARLQQACTTARTALAQHTAQGAALADRHGHAAASLAALLDEAREAFAGASPEHAGWVASWRGNPAAFRSARAADAAEWNARSAGQQTLASSLAALDVQCLALAGHLAKAEKDAATALAAFAQVDAAIGEQRRARNSLWEGRPAGDMERELAGAIASARAGLEQQQSASILAGQVETRTREALLQAEQRRATLAAAHSAAGERLAAWLAGFAGRHPGLDAPADVAALGELLARDSAWVLAERTALDALGAQAASAATVLAERRNRCEQHQQDAPEAPGASAGAVGAVLETLLAERNAAHDAAGALRVRLAQDNARRASSQAMMAEIDRQVLVERRWGRMNELIGSADGKKFRNYAQQFTLDVLLAYANSHLGQLARRYRLERVASAAGPSLGLMVRDLDMGGEVRSVNSLSGGESFLVSLALALGLASLSSNRVRVESLFIDEGFGSLDSETLRVAMDALDALQSMGRKVGVISHVQEMTERIATRIVVQPSGGGSSRVTVQ